MSKCIHSDYLNPDTYFLVYQNNNRSYKAILKGTWFCYKKEFEKGTKFKDMYQHFKTILQREGVLLPSNYDPNSFLKALKTLEHKQLKIALIN